MKVLIVEDVILVAERIEELTLQCFPHCEIRILHDVQDAKKLLAEQDFDLLLLDLNLNGDDGFEVLSDVTSTKMKTIVITANADRAAKAFDYAVLDFVTKPIVIERFKLAVERYKTANYPYRDKLKYLTVRTGSAKKQIVLEQVAFIKASGNYSEVHLLDGQEFLHDLPLDKLLNQLPDKYKRVHRSYAVDMARIEQIVTHGGGKYSARLNDTVTIPISRTFYMGHIYNKP